jgi:hypothetical protein
MIDWQAIKDQIRQAVSELTEMQPNQVIWRDEAKGATWNNPPTIYLRIPGLQDIGVAEERTTLPGPDDNVVVEVSQQKTFMLQVRCESFEQNIASPKFPGTILSTLRTRLRRSTSIFQRAGLFAIWDYGRVNKADFIAQDGRQVPCYVVDLRCATVDNDLDVSVGAGGWIREAEIAGTVDAVAVNLDVKT